MIEIKHRLSGNILFCGDFASIKEAAEAAVKNNVSLDWADLSNANLDNASFVGASFVRASFVGASVDGARFVGASFDGASFDGASFVGASFVRASFVRVSFVGARFDVARFVGASFDGASFDGASFVGASFVGASFVGAAMTKAPITIGGLRWNVTIFEHAMRIGCQYMPHEKWANILDGHIQDVGGADALALWHQYKPMLLALCAEHAGKNKTTKGVDNE